MRHITGLEWQPTGQVILSGPMLEAFRFLDVRFARWARDAGALEYRFSPFLPAHELHRFDFFRSSPHLATFAASVAEDPDALSAFAAGPIDSDGAVRFGKAAPVRDVLAPAACYHFYVMLQGRELAAPEHLTTVATCFRRESYYRPLQRQSTFTLREMVCLGTLEEVHELLDFLRQRTEGLLAALDLPVAWRAAADPGKTEMVYADEVALGAVSLHGDSFGEAFRITRGGEPAVAGCVAFGLERWLYALLTRYGPNPRNWPSAFVEAR